MIEAILTGLIAIVLILGAVAVYRTVFGLEDARAEYYRKSMALIAKARREIE